MTSELFVALIASVFIVAVATFGLITRPAFSSFVARTGVMPPPMIGAISILFGLFIGFNSADINQRAGALKLATQREVSAARSILNFSTGVGPKAAPVRDALLDYLEVATTTEPGWIGARTLGDPPGAAPAYSLSLIATGFVQEPGVSDVLKSALLARVDDLVAARTERLTLARSTGSIPQWIGLTLLASVTLLIGATSPPQRGGSAIFLIGYTATAIVAMSYLAYSDGLIGPNRLDDQITPFRALLIQAPRLTGYGEDTLARIRADEPVMIGARTDQYPFAFLDGAGKHVGYSVDLCQSIIAHLRASPAPSKQHAEIMPLSPANRVAMIVNGTADMECDLTTKTATRNAQVAFLNSIFFGKPEVVVLKESGFADLQGLQHKRLIAVVGSSNMQSAADLSTAHRLELTIIPAKDMPAAFEMLKKHEGDAMIGSDVLMRALINATGKPAAYVTLDTDLPPRSYGIMVRRGNNAFYNAANDALAAMLRSGELQAIYERWFENYSSPGFPSLHMPMTPELRRQLNDAIMKSPPADPEGSAAR